MRFGLTAEPQPAVVVFDATEVGFGGERPIGRARVPRRLLPRVRRLQLNITGSELFVDGGLAQV